VSSWAVGVTQRPASVTLPASGKLESANNPYKEKKLYLNCGTEYMIGIRSAFKKIVKMA
jgi:hypothetical protein